MRLTAFLYVPFLFGLFISQQAFAISFSGNIQEYDLPATLSIEYVDSDSGELSLDELGIQVAVNIHSIQDEGKYGIYFYLEVDGELPRKFHSQEVQFSISGKEANVFRELFQKNQRELSRYSEPYHFFGGNE